MKLHPLQPFYLLEDVPAQTQIEIFDLRWEARKNLPRLENPQISNLDIAEIKNNESSSYNIEEDEANYLKARGGLRLCTEDENVRFHRTIWPSRENDDRLYVVYWLFDDSCERTLTDGYVGVTLKSRLYTRILEHRRSKRFRGKKIQVGILCEDLADTCFTREYFLRPIPNMGWNIVRGGARGHRLGIPKTVEVRKKIGDANRGNKRSDLAEMNQREITCTNCGKFGRGPMMIKHCKACK